MKPSGRTPVPLGRPGFLRTFAQPRETRLFPDQARPAINISGEFLKRSIQLVCRSVLQIWIELFIIPRRPQIEVKKVIALITSSSVRAGFA